jgi:uncharacterized protein (DUF2164 family)
MPITLTSPESDESVASLQRYFREEFELELSQMRAHFILEYFLKEIGPLAYNCGVKDAEEYFRARTEDLGGICFEAPMTYWKQKKR